MTRWYSEKKREHFYKQAKKEGYRARSAYKLKQIQKKFNIIKEGEFVLDLGCAPGGWSQVAKELVGKNGKVIGVDILDVKKIDNINFIKGDMTKEETINKLKKIVSENKFDDVISDMSPDISGNYDMDQARSIYLCTKALETAEVFLKKEGNFICKAFEGRDIDEFIDKIKLKFKKIKRFNPKASRKSSSEIYIIAKMYQK
jgi:23S rRNA (uridine2552-2'-O)-methyltransferase